MRILLHPEKFQPEGKALGMWIVQRAFNIDDTQIGPPLGILVMASPSIKGMCGFNTVFGENPPLHIRHCAPKTLMWEWNVLWEHSRFKVACISYLTFE